MTAVTQVYFRGPALIFIRDNYFLHQAFTEVLNSGLRAHIDLCQWASGCIFPRRLRTVTWTYMNFFIASERGNQFAP